MALERRVEGDPAGLGRARGCFAPPALEAAVYQEGGAGKAIPLSMSAGFLFHVGRDEIPALWPCPTNMPGLHPGLHACRGGRMLSS